MYDAWGKPTGKTGTLASTLGTVQPFRYRGYVFDEESDHYYLQNRYYYSCLARFISVDLIVSGNSYAYCQNSPIQRQDATGCTDKIINSYYFLTDSTKFHVTSGNKCRVFTGSLVIKHPQIKGTAFVIAHDYTTGTLKMVSGTVQSCYLRPYTTANLMDIMFPQFGDYDANRYIVNIDSSQKRIKSVNKYLLQWFSATQTRQSDHPDFYARFDENVRIFQWANGLDIDGQFGESTAQTLVEWYSQYCGPFAGDIEGYDPWSMP